MLKIIIGKVESLEELDCRRSAKELTIMVHRICQNEELRSEFTAKDRLKRASLSSMNNIAEGFGRFSNKELIRFLNISTPSPEELHHVILLYPEIDFVTQDQKKEVIQTLKKTKYQTPGLIKYLNSKLQRILSLNT